MVIVNIAENPELFFEVVKSFDSEEPGRFFEVLQSVVQQDPSLVTCKDAADITLLHYAAAKGCRDSCEFLLVIPNALHQTREIPSQIPISYRRHGERASTPETQWEAPRPRTLRHSSIRNLSRCCPMTWTSSTLLGAVRFYMQGGGGGAGVLPSIKDVYCSLVLDLDHRPTAFVSVLNFKRMGGDRLRACSQFKNTATDRFRSH